MKTALITGVAGQTGSYLAEHLLSLDYKVYGMVRRTSTSNHDRLQECLKHPNFHICSGDMHDQSSLVDLLTICQPNEVYNMAAQSFVPTSWNQPLLTADSDAIGPLRMLEAIRIVNKKIKFYQASSSEMFGKIQGEPQVESTPFYPRSPYGVAKVFGHWITVNYRESYDIFACSGICFNHESPRRGPEFVTRKISLAVAAIKYCKQSKLKLGNLEASRDWGYAKDYATAIHAMMQLEKPDDFVISTGEKHTVREFAEIAFNHVGLDYNDFVEIDPALHRPAEVWTLLGDSTKLRAATGWQPQVTFDGLVRLMVDHDMRSHSHHDVTPFRTSS
jgi:GDPmannose 4,6-dehydratase